MKRILSGICIVLCLITRVSPVAALYDEVDLTQEEEQLIARTQHNEPVIVGIIPHNFPLSQCPPDSENYEGIVVEMLNEISNVTGLKFEYMRIPIEELTPYQTMLEGMVSLVAGTIKLDNFAKDPNLILSSRLADGSIICIAKQNVNPSVTVTGKIAILHGYQAGVELSNDKFSEYETVLYPTNQDVVKAVRKGEVDLGLLSRYVGIYELQSPFNEKLVELAPSRIGQDSCVMGLNTQENKLIISIIDKALDAIGESGYNEIQMNYSLTHPYKLSLYETMFKYRFTLGISSIALLGFLFLALRLIYAQKDHRRLSLDPLTGALSEVGFELMVSKVMAKDSKQHFITDFDIYRFSSYNELHGKDAGDELLKGIVEIVKSFLSEQDIICRSYADQFKVLSCKPTIEELTGDIQKAMILFNEKARSPITFSFGIYPVSENTVPISKMLDFAAIAKKSVKNNSDLSIGIFDGELLERYVQRAKMISNFDRAIREKEFVAYYQPKYNAITQRIVGAEALVRWLSVDGKLIPPISFIELFEKSGQIQKLDFYMLEQVCIFLNKLADHGITQLPIAVNFSRVHLYSRDFVQKINELVTQYGVDKKLIEIECTETTAISDIEKTKEILGELQAQGFSIAMDDFGSAYSSLNTLFSIPLDVIKLDGGFLRANLTNEMDKAKIIISSVIRLAHDLSLVIVAEGVETVAQYTFLKGLGCDIIQGYYFSKPLDQASFYELITKKKL